MAIATSTFTTNLAALNADEFTHTTAFGAAFRFGCVTFSVDTATVDLSDGITTKDTPIAHGIQENFEIWIDNGAGAAYDCRIQAGSMNGQKYLIWAPPNGQNFFAAAGSQIRVVIKNKHRFGTIYGAVTVETV